MRKLIALVAVLGMALLAACGPKLSEEEKTAPPPAGPEGYQAPPTGAVPSGPPQASPTTPAPAPTEGTEGAAPAGEGTAPAGEGTAPAGEGAAGTTSTTEGTGGGG